MFDYRMMKNKKGCFKLTESGQIKAGSLFYHKTKFGQAFKEMPKQFAFFTVERMKAEGFYQSMQIMEIWAPCEDPLNVECGDCAHDLEWDWQEYLVVSVCEHCLELACEECGSNNHLF